MTAPAKKQKRGKKGKKQAPPNQRGPGQAEDSDETFIAAPDRKGPRGPPSRRWRPIRRHAQEAVPLPQGLGQPHPRAVRDAPEVLQPHRESRRGQEEGC